MLSGYFFGYGYGLPPYATAYRRALRTTRTRLCTRAATRDNNLFGVAEDEAEDDELEEQEVEALGVLCDCLAHLHSGYVFGYGYCLPPYATAYREALRITRTRRRTRSYPVNSIEVWRGRVHRVPAFRVRVRVRVLPTALRHCLP